MDRFERLLMRLFATRWGTRLVTLSVLLLFPFIRLLQAYRTLQWEGFFEEEGKFFLHTLRVFRSGDANTR